MTDYVQEDGTQACGHDGASAQSSGTQASYVPEWRLNDGGQKLDGQLPHAVETAATASRERSGRFRTRPRLLDRMALGGDAHVAPPHLLHMLVSAALARTEDRPVCIVLPMAERISHSVAILAALEVLACDLPAMKASFIDRLKPGMAIRLPPHGEVFEIGEPGAGALGVRLLLPDRKSRRSNAARIVSPDKLAWFEPTTRRLPLGSGSTPLTRPPSNDLDAVVGQQVFCNSGLVRSRLLLLGLRSEFERALEDMDIRPSEGSEDPGSFRSAFSYGGIDQDGYPYVVEPDGSAGVPMVAVARDMARLERACFRRDVEPGSQIIITDRLDAVLRDLDVASRIGERHRLLLFANTSRRPDLEPLQRQGWVVWEPAPADILGRDEDFRPTGLRGIDRSRAAASAEAHGRPGFLTCETEGLREMGAALDLLAAALSDESVEHEAWVEDLLSTASRLFLSASAWLVPPSGSALESHLEDVSLVRSEAQRVRAHLGDGARESLLQLCTAIESFRASIDADGVTPKGSHLLRLARTAASSGCRQLFAAGTRQSREQSDLFLQEHGTGIRCVVSADVHEMPEPESLVVFSALRREVFERLADPWPCRSVLFLGYEFETDLYRRRLQMRAARRARMQVDPSTREAITGLPEEHFGAPLRHTSVTAPSIDTTGVENLDRVARDWNWSRRISIPATRSGDEACEAKIVRFVGRSWMAMTPEHRVTIIEQGTVREGARLREHAATELSAGMRMIVREGSDRDIIRIIAEGVAGSAHYQELREKASLWRRALRQAPSDLHDMASALRSVGVVRHPATIRGWAGNEMIIGPKREEDFWGIASAFPVKGRSEGDWRECWDAISELRALHIRAGTRLTEILARSCGGMLFEPSDTELAVDLDLGIIWVLEVAEVERSTRRCPHAMANRLHWIDQRWRDRLLAEPVRMSEG